MNLVYTEDVKSYLKKNNQPRFHFCLSDPPYEINHLGKWDNSRIAFDVQLYKLILSVLLPGAFALFYSSSRTMHRVMCAIEDAGFQLHKTMFAWVFSDGNPMGAHSVPRLSDNLFAKQHGGFCKCEFPDSHLIPNIGKFVAPVGLDVAFCAKCNLPIRQVTDMIQKSTSGGMKNLGGTGYNNKNIQVFTNPLTQESMALDDYVYGLGWSKPMLDPIIVAQKRWEEKTEIENVVRYGTGVVRAKSQKRWPGNFMIQHTEFCDVDQCSPDCLINNLGISEVDAKERFMNYYLSSEDIETQVLYANRKSADREFGLQSRNTHPSVKPVSVNQMLAELFLPPDLYAPRCAYVPFSGSGSETIGLRLAGWDFVESTELKNEYTDVHYNRYRAYFPEDEIVSVNYD